MAGAGAKKRIETNKGIVSRHQNAIVGTAALCFLCILFRLGSFKSQSRALALFGFVTSLGAELAAFKLISIAARPSYDEKGDVVDAGADLSVGGVSEHCFDIIYTVCFVHGAVVMWKYFWLVLLVIPGYALFKLIKDVVIPWCLAPDADDGDAGGKKKGKKEKKGRVVVGRR